MTKCADKHTANLSAYAVKGKENTSNTYEKKKNARDICVQIYHCGKY